MTDDIKAADRPAIGKSTAAEPLVEDRTTRPAEAAAEKIVGQAEKVADTASRSAAHIAEDGAALSLKLIALAELNLHHAFEAMRAATTAKDMSEVMRIQGDFLRDQGTRSVEQVREIGEMIADYGRSAMARITEHA